MLRYHISRVPLSPLMQQHISHNANFVQCMAIKHVFEVYSVLFTNDHAILPYTCTNSFKNSIAHQLCPHACN